MLHKINEKSKRAKQDTKAKLPKIIEHHQNREHHIAPLYIAF